MRRDSTARTVSCGDLLPDKFSRSNPQAYILERVLLGLVLLFVVLVRIRLLGFPLERDEGEYAYFGQLILQGIPPYQLAYSMKFPGIYALFALFEGLFGQTVYGIHLGLLVANVVTVILLFFLCKKLISNTAAIISSATYAVLSLSSSVLGFAAHATQFVVPFVLGGFLLLLRAFERSRTALFFLSGTLLGLAVLTKQSAAPFCLWGFGAIALNRWDGKTGNTKKVLNLSMFFAGILMPIAATLIILHATGVFDKFWFWTVTYLRTYAAQIPFSEGINIFQESLASVIDGFVILWVMALLGFCVIWMHPRLRGKKWTIFSFIFFSFVAICPGFYFRPHYFITLLPAVSLLVGIFFDFLNVRWTPRKALLLLLFLVVTLVGVAEQRDYFFWEDPVKLSRKIYGENPFPESPKVARVLQAITRKDESIAVLGSEPQIFFYSKRHSATGYIYMYGLMENQNYGLVMQKEMVREIEAENPRYIVFVECWTSWFPHPGASTYVFDWWNNLVRNNKYQKFGIVDIYEDQTIYRFGADTNNYNGTSASQILIYKRADNQINSAQAQRSRLIKRNDGRVDF